MRGLIDWVWQSAGRRLAFGGLWFSAGIESCFAGHPISGFVFMFGGLLIAIDAGIELTEKVR